MALPERLDRSYEQCLQVVGWLPMHHHRHFLQLSRDDLQHWFRWLPRHLRGRPIVSLRPELKSGEQICHLFKKSMSSGARDRPCPLISSSACSLNSSKVAMSEQCSIALVLLSPRIRHQVPGITRHADLGLIGSVEAPSVQSRMSRIAGVEVAKAIASSWTLA